MFVASHLTNAIAPETTISHRYNMLAVDLKNLKFSQMVAKWRSSLVLVCLLLLSGSSTAGPLTLRRAVDLSAQHSGAVVLAAADRDKARESYFEARGHYLPRMTGRSDLGYTSGLPLPLDSFPLSVLNVTANQSLFDPAQWAFAKSARARWQAASVAEQDKRGQAMLECALAYAQLIEVNLQLKILQRQERAAERLRDIESHRVVEGVDEPPELNLAKLSKARTRMRIAELESSEWELHRRLANLTGLEERDIEPIAESMPPLPDIPTSALVSDGNSVDSDPRVKMAVEQANASSLLAKGEHESGWPKITLVGQYALLPTFNNYDNFYKRFQPNNGVVGISIRLPLLDFGQTARDHQAEIDASKAHYQIDAVKSEISDEKKRLQGIVKQLQSARDVAQLEYILARTDTTKQEMLTELGKVSLGSEEASYVAEDEKLDALLDADFRLKSGQLQLLYAVGQLEPWLSVDGSSASAVGAGVAIASSNGEPGRSSETTASSPIKDIMMTPAVSTLVVGQSRQFSAILIYSNGTAKDKSSEAEWRCTSNWNAIVSSSGLVTALATGQVTVTVTYSGVSESQNITISDENAAR